MVADRRHQLYLKKVVFAHAISYFRKSFGKGDRKLTVDSQNE